MRSARPARLITVGSQREEHVMMVEQAPPWPKQGPASYFPSIEKKYGRSIAEWQQIIAGCGIDKHMAVVGYLKSEHGMGTGTPTRSSAGRSQATSPVLDGAAL